MAKFYFPDNDIIFKVNNYIKLQCLKKRDRADVKLNKCWNIDLYYRELVGSKLVPKVWMIMRKVSNDGVDCEATVSAHAQRTCRSRV